MLKQNVNMRCHIHISMILDTEENHPLYMGTYNTIKLMNYKNITWQTIATDKFSHNITKGTITVDMKGNFEHRCHTLRVVMDLRRQTPS